MQSSSDDNTHTINFYRVTAIPFLNTRTRKRYRDDRPNEEVIHENTLKKLFDAQRLHLDEAMPMSDVMNFDGGIGRAVEEDAEMTDDTFDVEMEIPQTVQPKQKTIEAFFGGGAGASQQVKVC